MAKFPVELFDVIPGIGSARIEAPLDPTETDLPEDLQPPGKKAPAGRTTRAQDPKLRAALDTAVVVRDLGRVVAGHGRLSREGITLAWHGSDMGRYTGKLARLP